jgi:hypothetical protein
VLVIPVRGSASAAVNRDTKAVVVDAKGAAPEVKAVDKRQALEGFVITSHAGNKSIINGPGGSRVVSDGQSVVLGGIEWKVSIVENGIEFLNGSDRVRLLFDRSLSTSSRTSTTSSGSSSGTTSTSTSAASTPSSSTAATTK